MYSMLRLMMTLLLVPTVAQSAADDQHAQPFERIMKGDPEYACAFHGAKFSSDGNQLLAIDAGRVRIWDIKTGKQLNLFQDPRYNDFGSAEWSPDGRYIASRGYSIYLWSVAGEQVKKLESHGKDLFLKNWVWSLAFDQTGQQLASAGDDEIVLLHDIQTGQATTLFGLETIAPSIMFDKEGRRLLIGGGNRRVYIYDIRVNRKICVLYGHTERVNTAKWDDSETKIVSAGCDSTARIFDIKMNKEMHRLEYDETVNSAEFYTPEEILSADNERTISIRDVNTGRYIQLLPRFIMLNSSVSLNKDRTRIASTHGRTVEVRSLPLHDHIPLASIAKLYAYCVERPWYKENGIVCAVSDENKKKQIVKLLSEDNPSIVDVALKRFYKDVLQDIKR